MNTSAGLSTVHMVHVDHLNRPVMMTDASKAQVWAATYLPFGGVHSITGTATLDARLAPTHPLNPGYRRLNLRPDLPVYNLRPIHPARRKLHLLTTPGSEVAAPGYT